MPNMKGIKLDISDLDLPYQRVILVTNLHKDTTVDEIRKFFNGYDVIDIKRAIDPDSGKTIIAYVMVGSMNEVVRAHIELNMEKVHGRVVSIEHAYSGFTITESGPFNQQGLAIENELPDETIIDNGASVYYTNSPVEFVSHQDLHQMLQVFPFSQWYEPAVLPTANKAKYPAIPLEPWTRDDITDAATADIYYIPGLQDIHLPQDAMMHQSPGGASMSSSSAYPPMHDDFENPKQRVLVIANLHPSVKVNDLRPFFSGYEIVDFKRSINHKTGKPAPIGFVLFRTILERVKAEAENNGRLLFGRPVRLEKGVNVTVWNTGFTRPNPDINHHRNIPTEPAAMRTTALNMAAMNSITTPQKPVYGQTTYNPNFATEPVTPPNRTRNTTLSTATPPSFDRLPSLVSPATSAASSISSAYSPPANKACPPSTHRKTSSSSSAGYSYKDLEYLSYSSSGEETEEEIAELVFGPWNLHGHAANDKAFNVVTEEEWYGFGVWVGVVEGDEDEEEEEEYGREEEGEDVFGDE